MYKNRCLVISNSKIKNKIQKSFANDNELLLLVGSVFIDLALRYQCIISMG